MAESGFLIPPGLNNNKATILAPWLYGAIVSSLAFGVLMMQTALYFFRYPRDRLYYKLTVGVLAATSIASWCATLDVLRHLFIDGFGSVLAMHAIGRAAFVPVAAPAFSGTISQLFFATRIYRLSGQRRWLGAVLVVLISTSLISGLLSIGMEPQGNFAPFNGNDVILFRPIDPTVDATFEKVITSIQVFLWVSAATDVVISALLVYFLLGEKKRDQIMGSTVTRVLVMGLTTGGLTALFSVSVGVIVLATIWSNNVNMGLTLSLNHVYALVCISSLNVRRAMSSSRKGSSMSQPSGHTTRPSMSTTTAYWTPLEKAGPLPSLQATATSPLSAGAQPFAHPQRPQPPRLNTRDLGRTNVTDRFESAHALETARTGSSAHLSPADVKSTTTSSPFPVLKGDVVEQVQMPRFSYLRRGPSQSKKDRNRAAAPPPLTERPRLQRTYNSTPL